jgi:hypothetical protein
MLAIQLWLDLSNSQNFLRLVDEYREHSQKRELVFLRALAFQKNNFLIDSLVREYK